MAKSITQEIPVQGRQSGNVKPRVLISERKRWLFFALPFTFTKYTLTNKKLIINQGLLVSKENEILAYRILDMTTQRSLIQKMFGLGSILVVSQDKLQPTLLLKNIKNCSQFKELLSDTIEGEKTRLGMRRGEIISDVDNHSDELGMSFDGDIDTM